MATTVPIIAQVFGKTPDGIAVGAKDHFQDPPPFSVNGTRTNALYRTLGPSSSAIWVLLNIVLGQTVVFTLNGRLSDIFGRRYFFIGGAALGVIGFVISGSANNLSTIIGGVSHYSYTVSRPVEE